MTFLDFQIYVQDNIINYLPDKYVGSKVTLQNVTKNNDTHLTGVCVVAPNSNMGPSIYLEEHYEAYKKNNDIDAVMKVIANLILQSERMMFATKHIDFSFVGDFDQVKDAILPKIINADANRKFLQDKPHKYIEDMAVIYYIDLNDKMLIVITNDMMNEYSKQNITINIVHETAVNNIIRDAICVPITPMGPPLILSKEDGVNGAACILNKQILNDIADKLQESFYIIPSSIDEVLLVPETLQTHMPEPLTDMLKDTNSKFVKADMKLSDNVYYFDRQLNNIVIAQNC